MMMPLSAGPTMMMPLSDAIRLGAMLKPQVYRDYFGALEFTGADVIGSCALGAALDAAFPADMLRCYRAMYGTAVETVWPWVARPADGCPDDPDCHRWRDCYETAADVRSAITHLNDYHHWTREQIAGWVATIEPASDAVVVDAALVTA